MFGISIFAALSFYYEISMDYFPPFSLWNPLINIRPNFIAGGSLSVQEASSS